MSANVEPYKVEIDTEGCPHCCAGRMWTIVGPDGVAMGEAWGDRDDAQTLADYLNASWQAALESLPK